MIAIIFTLLTKIKTASVKTKAVFLLLLIYLAVVFCYTVFMRPAGFHISQTEWFWSYRRWLAGNGALGLEILGNIGMFVPVGFLVAAGLPRRKNTYFMVVLAGLLFSCAIEFLQYELMRGVFEYDDIFNNTLGAVSGCLLYNILAKLTEKRYLTKTVLSFGSLFVVTGMLICMHSQKEIDIEQPNIPRSVCFQAEDAKWEGDRLTLTGFAFCYERQEPGLSLALKSTKTGKEVNAVTRYGLLRPDVAAYFNGKHDYKNTGFSAVAAGVRENEEYEVLMKPKRFVKIPTGVFVTGTDIHYTSQRSFVAPDVAGTALEEIVKNGRLRVYRPDQFCYVYQYMEDLYWIADTGFNFEEDGTTYIQYQLWTTRPEKLPEMRLKNKWDWDNIGGYFEKHEITNLINCGRYRVCKRKLPGEYPVTSIVTGYYKKGKWIWHSYFRPVYKTVF